MREGVRKDSADGNTLSLACLIINYLIFACILFRSFVPVHQMIENVSKHIVKIIVVDNLTAFLCNTLEHSEKK